MPNELFPEILPFSETGKASLLNSKDYKISVSIGLYSLILYPVIFGFDTGACADLVRADVIDVSWLENIGQWDMVEIRSAFNSKLDVSETMILRLRISNSRAMLSNLAWWTG